MSLQEKFAKTSPTFQSLRTKKMVGTKITMSITDNKTFDLWRKFMPRRKEIQHQVSSSLYSLQIYPADYFLRFNPMSSFEKWALIEVADFENIPEGMEAFILESGDYAVFVSPYSNDDKSIYNYIYSVWLPGSDYALADRPHFEILEEDYREKAPNAQEEIWIPISDQLVK